MPKVLVTGSKGQLGSELRDLVSDENFYFTDRDTLDISDKDAVENFCKKNSIDTIINCAAYTAVDKAEEDVVKMQTGSIILL